MSYRIYTDGSARTNLQTGVKGHLHPGGWAAIVRNGHSPERVLYGRETQTSSTPMELRAALEGLKVVPDGRAVDLVTDCELVGKLLTKWRRHEMPSPRNLEKKKRGLYWLDLAVEFERVGDLQISEPGLRHPESVGCQCPGCIHHRAHVIAGKEARACSQTIEFMSPSVPYYPPCPPSPKGEQVLHHAATNCQCGACKKDRDAGQEPRLRHHMNCDPSGYYCVMQCEVWRTHGGVYQVPHIDQRR